MTMNVTVKSRSPESSVSHPTVRPEDRADGERLLEGTDNVGGMNKRREWYRPVAPVVTADFAIRAFGSAVARSPLAGYMLGAYRPRSEWAHAFSGVVHRDGTVRVQVIQEDMESPRSPLSAGPTAALATRARHSGFDQHIFERSR
jgi:hypothetical protein